MSKENFFKNFLIKYSEIGLKGNNRYKFENALVENIKNKLNDKYEMFDVYKEQERIYVDIINPEDLNYDYDETIKKLKNIFGIFAICPVYKIDLTNDYNELSNKVINYMDTIYSQNKNMTFKVKTSRFDKSYVFNSDYINKELGHDILMHFNNFTVDVHNPDILLRIEIRKHINIYTENIKGAGGLPSGTSGKAMLLLSGGIDSPVAGYMISKRGVNIEAIYFDSPPYTSEQAKQKVIDLAKIVSGYSAKIKLHIINFTNIQMAIYENAPHDALTIIMRRYMMEIATILAKKNNCLALITGESIGQVASQTLSSLRATNEVADLPIFRPLIAYDKDDIIEIAKKINTFETSILPYEDCCTIFVATHPMTNPDLEKIKKFENNLIDKKDKLIIEAIDTEELIIC